MLTISRSSISKQITKGNGMAKDACYRKVKARYKVFPSAYASGAIAKCRKVGAANYGTGGKKKSKRKSSGKKRGKTY
jgi:hypothetical protein